MAEQALIVALISDLFFSVQVENAARALGYRVTLIERGGALEQPGAAEQVPAPVGRSPSEPLTGPTAALIARLAEWQPVLILLDLSSTAIPWADWIAAVKSASATRRIPVLAFGPHTDLDLRAKALDVGCDAVIARSRLVSALPELIQQYARRLDAAGLAADCSGELSALAVKGIALFNAQSYFDAHEELELAWGEDKGPGRELYRGILQVAVAYLQITRGNYRGALKMFLRLRQWLDPMPATCRGVDVEQLRQDALAARAALEAVGPDNMADFDRRLLQPVKLVAQPEPPPP